MEEQRIFRILDFRKSFPLKLVESFPLNMLTESPPLNIICSHWKILLYEWLNYLSLDGPPNAFH